MADLGLKSRQPVSKGMAFPWGQIASDACQWTVICAQLSPESGDPGE